MVNKYNGQSLTAHINKFKQEMDVRIIVLKFTDTGIYFIDMSPIEIIADRAAERYEIFKSLYKIFINLYRIWKTCCEPNRM